MNPQPTDYKSVALPIELGRHIWWRMTGSNRRPSACKADALPAELILLNGDPYGNRTHDTAVKGRCLNRLTNGPLKSFSIKLDKIKAPNGYKRGLAWQRPTLTGVKPQLPSALRSLTSVFGMGTGVTSSQSSPDFCRLFSRDIIHYTI